MSECTFCEIVAGRSPSHRVLEDEHTLAFLDIRPASPGHTLVVPRVHARDVWEISQASHGQVADMVHRVAGLLRTALAPDGVNVRHNTGDVAGQDVFHFHVHVIPRWRTGEAGPAGELAHVLRRITGDRPPPAT
ncbi:HIT family protein [Nonomuraea gerenzanensis]|nr:HIT family protein [Nonomuraea gerenzanensis]UBU15020.1 HIT family protein [Nonomuraea gerenzanensis]